MRLLILTQKIDCNDPVLGFFHAWVKSFSERFEAITVVCLEEGEHDLPSNVRVFSLGKEKSKIKNQKSKFKIRVKYIFGFYRCIWQERKNYDVALVHMNQEYVLLGGLFWNLFGKRVYLWRNHYAGSLTTDIASLFCTKIFCTSKYSYTAKYKKTLFMPVGIDTELFKPSGDRRARSILFLARMAPSKHPDLLLAALGILKERGVAFSASLYGSPAQGDEGYYECLKVRARELGLSSCVYFHGAIRNSETVMLYSAHELCVNASASGMYDKTIFEAAACGCLPLVSNRDLVGVIDERLLFAEGDAQDLARKIGALLAVGEEEKGTMRTRSRRLTVEHHSLARLGEALMRAMEEPCTMRSCLKSSGCGENMLKTCSLPRSENPKRTQSYGEDLSDESNEADGLFGQFLRLVQKAKEYWQVACALGPRSFAARLWFALFLLLIPLRKKMFGRKPVPILLQTGAIATTFFVRDAADIATLKEVFVDREYAVALSFDPKTIADIGGHIGSARFSFC